MAARDGVLQNPVHGVLETARRGIEPKGHTFQRKEAILRDDPNVVAALFRNRQVVETRLNIKRRETCGSLELIQDRGTIRHGMMGSLNARIGLYQIKARAIVLLGLAPTHKH